jgi:putative ABC transport system permease protein
MPLLRGRAFGPADVAGRPGAVIIDDSFAAHYFPNQNPIGQHIDDNQTDDKNHRPLTVVGVVPRVRSEAPGEEFDLLKLPQIYYCGTQMTIHENNLLVRVSKGDPTALAAAVAHEVQSIDPDQPVASISTMEKNIAESLATRRLTMTLLGFFGALALTLASVGLYGVMALSVTQRTREFGIRLALGAARGDVFRLAFGRGLLLVAVGIFVGLLGALGAGRALTSLLYDVGSLDLPALFTAILALTFVALLACWFPARRATRVDPIVALRYE